MEANHATHTAIGGRANGRPLGSRDRHGRCVRAVPLAEAKRQLALIGPRIRQLREEQDVSASELAAATGYHPQSILRWECGRGGVPLVACIQVATALGLQLCDVLEAA